MLDRKLYIITIGIIIMLIYLQGCAILQNAPVMEIHPSRLTCSNPNMVDGDLSTIGTFTPRGKIRKKYFANRSLQAVSNPKNYQVEIDGTLKTHTFIKLDKPTYIAYIEVHTASDIPKLALDFTVEEKSAKWENSFIQVQQHRNTDVKNHQVIRYDIRQKMLYLRITADGIEDTKNKTRSNSNDIRYRDETITPLKGGKIREVKFYERL
ncbi:hypothetical protein C6497_11170 [Candidatus Poribacteria bacterium]|nr:MAG: hypothetical protein C6497_11170 [Candidatus Poribacteria bacterium]